MTDNPEQEAANSPYDEKKKSLRIRKFRASSYGKPNWQNQ
jgi:hypothetical protein